MIKITRMMRFATGRPRGGDALTFESPEEHPMFRSLRHWPAAFRALRSSQVQARPPRRSRRRPTRRCLPLEQLEGRLVLSAFHVTTLADGGAGSLRAAIAQANAHAGADIIDFQPGLTGTIALTGGELDITDDLTINGPGADRLTVSGNNISRVFKVESGETVTISGLTIAGGNAGSGNGGGIDNFGTLTVSNVRVLRQRRHQRRRPGQREWRDGDGARQHLHRQLREPAAALTATAAAWPTRVAGR